MADLLELLLSLVLSLLDVFLDLGPSDGYGSVGWRFFLPFMISVWIIVFLECRAADSGASSMLSTPIFLAGAATGIIWELWYNRMQ
jgi:hypothetical protein